MPPKAYLQREALIGAMVEAISRHGYAGVTIAEVLKIAGVSKRAFYERFEDKRDCFLAAHEALAEQGAELLTRAFLRPGDLRERLLALHRAADGLLAERPAEAGLVVVDSLTLGTAAVQARERAGAGFEATLRHAFLLEGAGEISARTARAIVGGTGATWRRRLRSPGRANAPAYTEALVDWSLAHAAPDDDRVAAAMRAASESRPPAVGGRLGWDEPPASPVGRAVLKPRERISRATANLVVADGFEAIGIPAISAEAGTSNATFYELFDDKRGALLAAFDALVAEAREPISRALEEAPTQAAGQGAAIRALLEHVAANETFAQLAFLQLPTAGLAALDHGEAALDDLLRPIFAPTAPAPDDDGSTAALRVAARGGLWDVVRHEIVRRRAWALPEMAPEIAAIALRPLSPSAAPAPPGAPARPDPA
jgi:AcrR family transcriptional regulator